MRRLLPLAALAALTLPASAQDAAPEPPRGDGIHVVGAWTLTVLDPDGSLVERREFHNDLTDTGALVLGKMLAGGMVAGTWEVRSFIPEIDDFYIVAEPGSGREFDNLIVSEFNRVPEAGVSLSGSFTASADGTVRRVTTFIEGCPGSVSPDACGAGQVARTLGGTFTLRQFETDERLSFVSGQTVQVQVDISFDYSDFVY